MHIQNVIILLYTFLGSCADNQQDMYPEKAEVAPRNGKSCIIDKAKITARKIC